MQLGVAPAGTPDADVDYVAQADLAEGWFSGSVDAAGLAAGAYAVWAGACLGEVCGAASTPLTVDG